MAERLLGLHLPFEVFLIASTWLGLLLPTVVITRLVDGSTGVRALRHGMLRVRASVGWYALALLAVPALATLLAVLMVGPPNATPTTVLSAIGSGLLLQTAITFATTQLWEETAWMGFVQVRLQARCGQGHEMQALDAAADERARRRHGDAGLLARNRQHAAVGDGRQRFIETAGDHCSERDDFARVAIPV